MHIKLSISYIISFLLLTVVLLEQHEIVHILVGRFICACWGVRDFNGWSICDECDKVHLISWMATLAGPLFSFGIMWMGMFRISSPNSNNKAIGFSLIFANIPFGRICEAMKGADDEMVVTRHLLRNNFSFSQMILICPGFVLIPGLPPIIKAFRVLINNYSWLYIPGFLTLPIAFILIYILIGMNSLLSNRFLSNIGIIGTPLLITIHTTIAIAMLIFLYKKLFLLNQTKN
jgi:hypothetical protein